MAIVSMQKLSILAMLSDRQKLMEMLINQGITHIEDISQEEIEERFGGLFLKENAGEKMTGINTDIKAVKDAINVVAAYVDAKNVMFAPKRGVTKKDYDDVVASADSIMKLALDINSKKVRLHGLKSEKNRIESEILSLKSWENLPFAAGFSGTKTTKVLTGIITSREPISQIISELEEEIPEAYLKEVYNLKYNHYIYVVYHRDFEEKILSFLSKYEFSQVSLQGKDSVSNLIKKLKADIEALEKLNNDLRDQFKEFAKEKYKLEILYDYLSTEKVKLSAIEKMANTDSVFMIKGFTPKVSADTVKKSIEDSFTSVVFKDELEDNEKPPVLLKNNRFIEPFEVITETYSLPDPKGIDPNSIMAPFFLMFFGMMLSDAGYGIIISLLTAFIVLKFKPGGQAGKLMRLMFWGGISTIIWGAIFGGWFGDIIPILTENSIIPPRLLDPLNDPITMLVLSFILGGIHLLVGMGAKAYMMIKSGDTWGAVFDIGLWYLVLIGIGLLFFGGVIADIGKYMAITGAIGLVLTQGRSEKNIFKKFFTGLLSLYDIIGHLSDVLSYSRLLALGLSTGVVASVVNTMAVMGGNNVFGWILFVVAFLIGHVFNMGINILGAYVHTSRLQYVEFFGKFYESGGRAFKPFKPERKYVEVVKD